MLRLSKCYRELGFELPLEMLAQKLLLDFGTNDFHVAVLITEARDDFDFRFQVLVQRLGFATAFPHVLQEPRKVAICVVVHHVGQPSVNTC